MLNRTQLTIGYMIMSRPTQQLTRLPQHLELLSPYGKLSHLTPALEMMKKENSFCEQSQRL